MQVGDGIESPVSGFTFHDPKVAEVFDRHVALSVPEYDYLQLLVGSLSQYYVKDGGCVVDYGCATGRTLAEIARQNPGRKSRYLGLDESPAMVEKARERLSGVDGAEIIQGYIQGTRPPHNTSLILAIYSLQFLDFADRFSVLTALSEVRIGTAMILVEKTIPDERTLALPFSEIHTDEKLAAYEPVEVIEKMKSLRGKLRPATMRQTEDMLRATDWKFQRFWQHLSFVGWVCLK